MKVFAPLAGVLAALCLSTSAHAEDSWTGDDKKMHFAGSVGLGVVAGSVIEDKRIAFGAVFGIGLAKEFADMRPGGSGFSHKDLAWDAAGALIGVQLGGLVLRRNFIGYRAKF